MTIGLIVGAPFLTFSDVIGRRGMNFIGNFLVIISALIQGLAPNIKVFMLGRFILGFGAAMMSSPQYMGEIAPGRSPRDAPLGLLLLIVSSPYSRSARRYLWCMLPSWLSWNDWCYDRVFKD